MTTRPFALHPRLEADCLPIGGLALSRVLLMNDATYPWLILVPERANVREIDDLTAADRALLIEEVALAGAALREAMADDWPIEKINVGALGNIVAQLHIHIVGRRSDDAAWPAPVWGRAPARPYEPAAARRRIAAIAARFGTRLRVHSPTA